MKIREPEILQKENICFHSFLVIKQQQYQYFWVWVVIVSRIGLWDERTGLGTGFRWWGKNPSNTTKHP